MPSSVYIHIPFCKSICSYCDFCKMFYNKDFVDKYLIALRKEIESLYNGELIKTIYIGGGSPSSLSFSQLEILFDIVKIFNFEKDIEFTIEVNVSDITDEMLKLFKNNNVNRLSIGIETVNERYMKFLNRFNKKDLVIEKVNLVKSYFENFNLDLMYAFPNETVDDVIEDLDFVTSFNPKHISIYSLIIEEHTKLFIEGVEPIDEDLESQMYYEIIKYLNDKDFVHYEVSNFAKDGYQSRHNLVYWNNLEYYGFGLGASGYVSDTRYTNTRNLFGYIDGNYVYEKELISCDIKMENELMLGLRKVYGVNKKSFLEKYDIDIYDCFDIINLIKEKYLVDDGENIFIPIDKFYVSNSILINFIGGSK